MLAGYNLKRQRTPTRGSSRLVSFPEEPYPRMAAIVCSKKSAESSISPNPLPKNTVLQIICTVHR
jgi:hypothetical protein